VKKYGGRMDKYIFSNTIRAKCDPTTRGVLITVSAGRLHEVFPNRYLIDEASCNQSLKGFHLIDFGRWYVGNESHTDAGKVGMYGAGDLVAEFINLFHSLDIPISEIDILLKMRYF
jgi:hypothetical protein